LSPSLASLTLAGATVSLFRDRLFAIYYGLRCPQLCCGSLLHSRSLTPSQQQQDDCQREQQTNRY
jgi:hypothetical protein